LGIFPLHVSNSQSTENNPSSQSDDIIKSQLHPTAEASYKHMGERQNFFLSIQEARIFIFQVAEPDFFFKQEDQVTDNTVFVIYGWQYCWMLSDG
jgi:hypothetical protein